MTTISKIAFKIEELATEAEKIQSLQEAIYAAIFKQDDFGTGTYEFAFVAFGEKVFELKEQLKKLKKEAFDILSDEEKTLPDKPELTREHTAEAAKQPT